MLSTVRTSSISALRELTAVLLFYAALSAAISWPLAAHFTTALAGGGLDALSHLWGVWHAVQALAGREPLFSTDLLYFPAGASLLLHSAGPVTGALALPFWPLGPIAGYNGGLLVGLTLTGGAMYLLARDIGCSRPAAIFAGIVLLAAPIHLVGLRGHLAKVFLGLLPVGILALRRALDARRPVWWAAIVGAASLAALLHSPLQFIQLALAAPVFGLAAVVLADNRREAVRRTVLVGVAVAVIAGPLLVATARAAADPSMSIDRRDESAAHQPDLAQFVLPPSFSALFGERTTALLARWNVTPEIETEVSVPLVALLLAIAAAILRPQQAAVWLALFAGAGAVAAGPTLRAFGGSWLESEWAMPYTWLTTLPGLDFLRTPPRFMQAGFVGLAAAAALGLSHVTRTVGAWPLAALGSLLVLIQVWPAAWPTQALPPTPAFYADLAGIGERFGVLDLPVRPLPEVAPQDYSARYQAYQLVHRKGIVGGYLSRVYARHPISPCVFADDRAPQDVRVNGQPSRCEPAAIHQLAARGYRFVVWHLPSDRTLENLPGSWAEEDARAFADAAFGTRKPLVDDELVRVWEIPREGEALPAEPVMELGPGWYAAEPEWRWAQSPATILVTAPRQADVELSISMRLVHDRNTGRGLGENGVLVVTAGRQSLSRPFKAGDVVRVPLTLSAGSQTVSLALGAGNFRPSDFGETDTRPLSFAIEWLDLTTR